MKSLFSTFTATALLATVSTTAALSPLSSSEYSDKVKNCPGYAVSKTENTSNGGVRAYLNLASGACNGFGPDEKNLVLEAEYETKERLHVKIFDQVSLILYIFYHILTRNFNRTRNIFKFQMKFLNVLKLIKIAHSVELLI